ncbi:unnamed protein product [Lathyrus oleraceus]
MAGLKGIQSSTDKRDYHARLAKLEQNLQEELSHILKKEDLIWFQRSRSKWFTDEDCNTRYYHIKVINIRRRNKITNLNNKQGVWIDEENDLKVLVNELYRKFFKINNNWSKWSQTSITNHELNNI